MQVHSSEESSSESSHEKTYIFEIGFRDENNGPDFQALKLKQCRTSGSRLMTDNKN